MVVDNIKINDVNSYFLKISTTIIIIMIIMIITKMAVLSVQVDCLMHLLSLSVATSSGPRKCPDSGAPA